MGTHAGSNWAQLLGPKMEYLGNSCTVEEFVAEKVSLPPVQRPVPLVSVLDDQSAHTLRCFDTLMLADYDVVVAVHQYGEGSIAWFGDINCETATVELVAAFLREEPRATLLPATALADGAPCRAGELEHTLRFEPRASQTSALFVARLGKRASRPSAAAGTLVSRTAS